MTKYKSKFTGQQIDDGIEYGVRVTQQTLSSAQKQQARGNIGAQETVTDMAKLGCGIGTCSTDSGTALVVSLTDYELVKNGHVSVTFENDVPAGATLNINGKGAKPIIYKGSAIESDTIKADDTVMFCYDGTNYVVTSLGGGTAVNLNETVNISLIQVGGNSADLIDSTIVVTDLDTGNILLSTTWQGSSINLDVEAITNYSIEVGAISGYLTPSEQHYIAKPSRVLNVEFQYFSHGVYIESTDHNLYTSSQWSSAGKTANSVVLITSKVSRRIALVKSPSLPMPAKNSSYTILSEQASLTDYDGYNNTKKIITVQPSTSYAPGWCYNYVFPDGVSRGHQPSIGELLQAYNNKAQITACMTACGGADIENNFIGSSDYSTVSDAERFIGFRYNGGSTYSATVVDTNVINAIFCNF